MIYNVLWLSVIPGKRNEALAHLDKMAKHITTEHGVPARVFVPITTGPIYLTGLVVGYENMATTVKTGEAIAQSKQFETWFSEALNLFAWSTAEWETYRAVRPAAIGDEAFANFIQVIGINVIPGKLDAARKHMVAFAEHYEATYGRPVDVLSFEAGQYYRHHFVVGFDDMAQYETVGAALQSDAVFAKWSEEMLTLFDNASLETNIGRYL